MSGGLLTTRSERAGSVASMDRTAALDLLPEAYATALRLRDEGQDDGAIARALGVEAEAVGPMLRLADAKLRGLLQSE